MMIYLQLRPFVQRQRARADCHHSASNQFTLNFICKENLNIPHLQAWAVAAAA